MALNAESRELPSERLKQTIEKACSRLFFWGLKTQSAMKGIRRVWTLSAVDWLSEDSHLDHYRTFEYNISCIAVDGWVLWTLCMWHIMNMVTCSAT